MSHTKRKFSECLNCGTRLAVSHTYCPECGQPNHDLNIPVRHLLEELLEGVFHFDTKIVRTIKNLAVKPGFVTSEFIKGKRVEYVAPVRLYIFISFLFFLMVSLQSDGHETGPSTESQSSSVNISFYGINSQDLKGFQQTQLDSLMKSRGIELSALNRYAVRQLSRIANEGLKGFNHLLVKGISYMMFVLMPLFALFVFPLNRKKAQYYIGTLIFSVHYHIFVFLLLTVCLVVNLFADIWLIWFFPIIISPMYLFLALRYIYNDSRLKTIGKTMFIGVLQFVSLALLFLITTFISLMIL